MLIDRSLIKARFEEIKQNKKQDEMHESKLTSDKESFVINGESKSDYSNEEFFDAFSISILDEPTSDAELTLFQK